MTPEQLDAIEAELGFPLTAEYRRVAGERPFRPIRGGSIDWFFDQPDEVIRETRRPQDAGGYEGPRWPAGSLAIGFGACGDTYVLDTRAEGHPVHCLSHETLELEPDHPTFEAF